MTVNWRIILNFGLILAIIGLLTCLIILASVPPISRDALIHHLALPKLYLQHGSIYEIPELSFSYYPMNLDLLYMGALYLGSDILPKYIHMAFGFATAFLLYRYLKNKVPVAYAYLGALFFLSIPLIVKLSITVYVDLGLTFLTTASLFSLFQWVNQRQRGPYLILAGLCCGLALGTKYNGLLVLFLLTLIVPVLYTRTTGEKRYTAANALKNGIVFFLCAVIVASPWLIKNSILTGNPIYPLYDVFFNPPTAVIVDSATSEAPIRGVFATRHVLYGEKLGQLLLLPVRIFFEGMDDDPRYFDGRLNPFLLLLPIFAFWNRPVKDTQVHLEKITLLAFSLLYFLFAFNTSALRIRYFAPIVPFLVILSIYGLHNLEIKAKHYLGNRKGIVLLWLLPVAFMLTLNCFYVYQQFQNISPFSYINGHLSRDEYLIKYRPEYKMMQYANAHLPESSKILCIFMGWRGYYLDREHIFDHHRNQDGLIAWLKLEEISAQEILKRLEKQSISHMLIRTDLFDQWVHQNVPDKNKETLTLLITENLNRLSTNYNYSLFEVDN